MARIHVMAGIALALCVTACGSRPDAAANMQDAGNVGGTMTTGPGLMETNLSSDMSADPAGMANDSGAASGMGGDATGNAGAGAGDITGSPATPGGR